MAIVSVTASGHEGRLDRHRGRRVSARLLRLASDEKLVELARAGSDSAFEVVYARYHRGILSFCRHMLGSAEEAEDALQHTFLAAYRALAGSEKEVVLRPWLYTIARNRCLSMLRARRERASVDLEPATEHLSTEVERRHDLRAMLGDLAGLPPDQRAALLLTELGDMSHDEIGAVLGCRREKVKALVFQARSSLIASRNARETSCAEIREQLANLRGGSLRRNTLRRHLRECEGCRAYREQVSAQRRDLALILPVLPTLGLKAAVLGAAGIGAASAGGGAVVATTIAVLAVAGGGTVAVESTRDKADRPPPERAAPARVAPAAVAPAAAATVADEPRETVAPRKATARPRRARRRAAPDRPVRSPRSSPPAAAPVVVAAEPEPEPAKAKPPRAAKVKAPKPVKVKAPKPVKPPKPLKVKKPHPVTGPPEEVVGAERGRGHREREREDD